MPKKPTNLKLEDDTVLAEILGELEDKPNDGTTTSITSTISTKQSDAALAKDYMASFINNIKMKEKEKHKDESSDDELLDRIFKPKQDVVAPKKVVVTSVSKKSEILSKAAKETSVAVKDRSTATTVKETIVSNDNDSLNDEMDFNCLHDDENQFEIEQPKENATNLGTTAKITTTTASVNKAIKTSDTNVDDLGKLLNNWESICQMDNFEEEINSTAAGNTNDSSTFDQKNLRFWYWEAWEDANKLPGEIFLFGRTAEGKSVCVRVEKIERVLYLLPREYVSNK